MAEKLKIIPLGGLGEIGKNMTLYEYGNDMILVDCGLGFPDYDMYGVDVVIPDITYLVKNKEKLRAMFLTHGHEDHIGAMPYVMQELSMPVYATRMTAGLVKLKLEEAKIADKVALHTVEAGETVQAGCFKVEFIHVNHSIADSVAFAIKTPVGLVVQTGDYKIDPTPIDNNITDLTRFGELGKKGVLALLADSTNADKPGYSRSERLVGQNLDVLFRDCKERIIVTTFASNVHRLQQVVNCAAKYGRKVAITGRSMENMMKVSAELGYMTVPQGTLMDLAHIKNQPREKTVIITTGSQGESMSALYRMAFSDHRQLDIEAGDRVIISASSIPGNEKTIGRVINELYRRGAEVIDDHMSEIHASGHACQEEMRIMLSLIRPRFFIPVHGEQRHLKLNANLAIQSGIPEKNVLIAENGSVIKFSSKSAAIDGTVPSGKVLVDGSGVGDVGSVVLRDRKHLAQDGMLVVVVSLSGEDCSLISGPDIITRGFVYVKESDDLLTELKLITVETLDECRRKHITDWATIKRCVKNELSDYLYRKTRKNPMVLPVIMEI